MVRKTGPILTTGETMTEKLRQMILAAAARHKTPPRKEQEQAARRPDRTPREDRPRPTEERAVLIRRPG